jgi:hypothetical protein
MCCDFADKKDSTVLSLFSMQAMDKRPFHEECWKIYCGEIQGIVGPSTLEKISRYVEKKENAYRDKVAKEVSE